MSEELKPCPCCGSNEIAEGYDTEGNSAFTCEGCGLGTAWDPTDVARAAWNRRAPMTAPTPAGEEGERARLEAQKLLDAFPNGCWLNGSINAFIVARALLSSPRVEEVRREALEEAAAMFENAAHTEWFGHEAADAIRALSPTSPPPEAPPKVRTP